MCASFGFDFDNDGITSWEDDYFGQAITEDPIEKKDNIVYVTHVSMMFTFPKRYDFTERRLYYGIFTFIIRTRRDMCC